MITMYGIPNCDTIKKAKKWLEAEGIEYHFHDYRKAGINRDLISLFFEKFSWESVVNKRGTTYRQLSEEQKNTLNEDTAIQLLLDNPAMIKRPILLTESTAIIGFKAADYEAQLK